MLRRGRCFALFGGFLVGPQLRAFQQLSHASFFVYNSLWGEWNKTLKMRKSLLSALAVGLCLSANVMAQVPSYVPTNGLVGYWPFNGNANDESGNGNNGTNNGATLTTDRFGINNASFNFQNNIISIPHNSSFGFLVNSGFTISIWCNISNLTNVFQIIGKRANGSPNFNWQIAYGGGNGPNFGSGTGPGLYNGAYSPDFLLINNWYHIVGKYDNGLWTIFVNGILKGTNNSANVNMDSNIPISIGNSGNFEPFYGSLDDIGIWNRALSQQEITDLYNGCSVSTIASQPTNQTVNPTTSAQFVVNATSGSSFQWQTDLGLGFQNLSNAGQYSGANNDTLVVSNASISNNNQQFRCVVNPGSCADTSNVAVLTVSTVGMDELSVQGNVSLYPNPTQSSFEIQTSLVYSKIEIRDMQGRIVKTENAAKTINLSSLQKGTYSVNLLDEKENTLAVRKIVLQ